MRDKITYEWTAEQIDEHGDIQDADHADKRRELDTDVRYTSVDVGVVRTYGNDDGVMGRTWAYIEDGILPDHFCDGTIVPQRFHKEI